MASPHPVLILIHGTTQNPAGYDALIDALAHHGYHALAPALRPDTATTSAEHADAIAAQLPDDIDRPVVLAHSGAGVLLPAIARRLNARHQIWLAAAVADHHGGRSLLAEITAAPDTVMNPDWIGVNPATEPALATYFLFHDAALPALRHALANTTLTDLTAAMSEQPTEDPTRIPSTYLLPTGDRTLQPSWMTHIARERLGVTPVELDGGHNLYAGQPELVATAITTALDTVHP